MPSELGGALLAGALKAGAVGFLIASGAVAAAQVDLEVGSTFDTNIGRGERGVDRLDDVVIDTGVRLSERYAVSDAAFVSVDLGLRHDQHIDRGDLSHGAVSTRMALRHRLSSLGAFEWLELSAEAGYRQHHDSDLRDGPFVNAAVVAQATLAALIDVRGGYRYDWRRGEQSAVFDLEQHRVFVEADMPLTRNWLAYGALEWRDGEVVSTATADRATLAVATAAATDTALAAPGRRRVAYQLEGSSAVAEIGLNVALTPALALDASVLYHSTRARADHDYHGVIGQFALLYRWR